MLGWSDERFSVGQAEQDSEPAFLDFLKKFFA